MPDDAVTVDYMLEPCWIVGGPSECANRLNQLYNEVGGFSYMLTTTHDPDGYHLHRFGHPPLGGRVTVPILMGTLGIILGTVLLSLSGKQVGFRGRHLIYPFLCASCFGVVAVIRKLRLGHAGPLFGSAINATAATVAATVFVLASGNRRALVCDGRTCSSCSS